MKKLFTLSMLCCVVDYNGIVIVLLCHGALLIYNVTQCNSSSWEGNSVWDLCILNQKMNVFFSYFCKQIPVCWCRDCLWTVLLVLKWLCRPLSCDIAWIRLFSVPAAGLITDEQIDSPYICPEVLSFSLSYFHIFILFSVPSALFSTLLQMSLQLKI